MFNEKTNKLCISILFAVILFSGSIPTNAPQVTSQEETQDQYLKKIDAQTEITEIPAELGQWVQKLNSGFIGAPPQAYAEQLEKIKDKPVKWRGEDYETEMLQDEYHYKTKIGLVKYVKSDDGTYVAKQSHEAKEGIMYESGIVSGYYNKDSCSYTIYDNDRIIANESPLIKSDTWVVKYALAGTDNWIPVEQNILPCKTTWKEDANGFYITSIKSDKDGTITEEYFIPKVETNDQAKDGGLHKKVSYTNNNPTRTNHKIAFSNILSDTPDHISIELTALKDQPASALGRYSTNNEYPIGFGADPTYVGNELNIPRERLVYADGTPTTSFIQFHFTDPKANNLFYKFDQAFDKLWNIRIKNQGSSTDVYIDYMNTEEILGVGKTTSIDPIIAQNYFDIRRLWSVVNDFSFPASANCAGSAFIDQVSEMHVLARDTTIGSQNTWECKYPFYQYDITSIPDNAVPIIIKYGINYTYTTVDCCPNAGGNGANQANAGYLTEYRGEDVTTLNLAAFGTFKANNQVTAWDTGTVVLTAVGANATTALLSNTTFTGAPFQFLLNSFEQKLETGDNLLTICHGADQFNTGCVNGSVDLGVEWYEERINYYTPQFIEVTYEVFNPPTAPTNFTCVGTSPTTVHLDWDNAPIDFPDTISNHNIQRNTGGGFINYTNTGTALTFFDDTVPPLITVQYKVAAISTSAGLGAYSSIVSCGALTVPDPPTDLIASNVGLNQVVLDWLAPAFNGNTPITGYRIERNNGTGFINVTQNTGNTLVEFFDTTVERNTLYGYRIFAINSQGGSEASNPAFVTTLDLPDPPTNAQATALSISSIRVTWDEAVDTGGTSITGYKIDRAIGASQSSIVNNGFTGSSSTLTIGALYIDKLTFTPILANVTHITATCNASCSSALIKLGLYSTNSSGLPSTLIAETASTTLVSGLNNVTLTSPVTVQAGTYWVALQTNSSTASFDFGTCALGNAKFHTAVTYGTLPNPLGSITDNTSCLNARARLIFFPFISYISNTGTSGRIFNDLLLTSDTLHSYIIKSRTIAGISTDYSNIAQATTFATPSAPTSLVATSPFGSTINLTWIAPTSTGGSPITGYKIERDSGGGFVTLVSNTGNALTTFQDTGLPISSTFSYRVSAINAFGTSPVSNTSTTSTPATPRPPENLEALGSSGTSIFLIWDQGSTFSPVTGYKIERKPVGGVYTTIVANTGNTLRTFQNTGLEIESTFVYRVSAITSSEGTSAPSNEATGSTFSAPDFPPENVQGTFPEFPPYQINMTWREPDNLGSGLDTGYRIQRDTGSGFANYVNVSSTSFIDDQLDNTTGHKYRIFAFNEEGESDAFSIAIPSDTQQVSHWHFENTVDDTGFNENTGMVSGTFAFTNNGSHIAKGFSFNGATSITVDPTQESDYDFDRLTPFSMSTYYSGVTNSSGVFSNQLHDFSDTHIPVDWNGNIWVEKFTGLPAGQIINALSLKQLNFQSASVRVKIYQDDGGTFFNNTLHDFQATNKAGVNGLLTGFIQAQLFTGLPVGFNITAVSLNVQSFSSDSVRVKIYRDDGAGGDPSTLLGESPSTALGGNGIRSIPVNATIPPSGNVWAGFEQATVFSNFFLTDGLINGTVKITSHAYGDGASPFGNVTNHDQAVWMRVTYINPISGYPSTLLGESGSVSLPNAGINTVPVTATIPASGNVWAGFEATSLPTFLQSTGLPNGTAITVGHVYGSGVNPFGTATNQTRAPYMDLIYGSSNFSNPNQVLVAKANSLTSTGYKLIVNHTKPMVILTNTVNTNEIKVRAESVVNDGNPHFIMFTYNGNGSASGVKFKVDGTFPTNTIVTNTLSGSITNNEPLTFGGTSSSSNYLSATSVMDETRIYNRELTTVNSQADEIFNENLETFEPLNATMTITPSGIANISGELVTINLITGFPPPDVGTILLKNFTTTTVNSVTPAVTIDPITGQFVFDKFYNIFFSTSNYTATTTLDNGNTTFPLLSNFNIHNVQFILNTNIFFSHERTPNFAILFYNITRTTFPFDLQCNIKFELFGNGTTYNFTNVGFVQTSVPVPPNRNAYVACIDPNIPLIDPTAPSFGGANSLLSFVSYGDTSGIGSFLTFTANYGNFFGVSLPFLFIIMLAALFTGRSAPTGIIIVGVAIGIMWYIGIFTLQPFMWAVVVILVILGLLGGKRFF